MKLLLLPVLLLMCLSQAWAQDTLTYTVTIDPRTKDFFQVQLQTPPLGKEQSVFHFAATAPGTYQVMDIGRFVNKFEALDQNGKRLKVKQLSTNHWQLLQPERTRQLRYTIAETWDTPVKKNEVYRMCGTSLEADHALLNGQAIFGYFSGWQQQPFRIKLQYPEGWKAGTALKQDKHGYYHSSSYDHAVDSPILVGNLTTASNMLGSTRLELYCYSKTGMVQAEELLSYMQEMLQTAEAFLVKLPVERYTFLFHFEDEDRGAWEHSYSSEYVLREAPLNEQTVPGIISIAAHEFLHIVTPLNIHSEVIEKFNFGNPTGSQHLWLYEGVTEWSSGIMQLRSGILSPEAYLAGLQQKLRVHYQMDTTYSLTKLGLTSFSREGQKQYGNIYNYGALVAGLLDLRLLELSGGTRGLREVLLDLAHDYGPNRPFSERDFFDELVQRTHPEISDFISRYIKGTEPLPVKEYYKKIGITYHRSLATGHKVSSLGMEFELQAGKVLFDNVTEPVKGCGIRNGDTWTSYNGRPVNPENLMAIIKELKALAPGTEYTIKISRNGKEKEVRCRLQQKEEVLQHHLAIDPAATPSQKALRGAWLQNLPLVGGSSR